MKNVQTLKILLLVSLLMVLSAGAFGGAYFLNSKWEKENAKWVVMKEQIVEEHAQVQSVSRIDAGPHCIIGVVMKKDCDFDQIKAIFTDILTQLKDEELRQELRTYHAGHASGELAFLEVCFTDPENKETQYSFSAYKGDGFEKWTLNDSIDPDRKNLKYNMSDYEIVS